MSDGGHGVLDGLFRTPDVIPNILSSTPSCANTPSSFCVLVPLVSFGKEYNHTASALLERLGGSRAGVFGNAIVLRSGIQPLVLPEDARVIKSLIISQEVDENAHLSCVHVSAIRRTLLHNSPGSHS